MKETGRVRMEQNKSTLSRALAMDGQISVAVVDATSLVREAAKDIP